MDKPIPYDEVEQFADLLERMKTDPDVELDILELYQNMVRNAKTSANANLSCGIMVFICLAGASGVTQVPIALVTRGAKRAKHILQLWQSLKEGPLYLQYTSPALMCLRRQPGSAGNRLYLDGR